MSDKKGYSVLPYMNAILLLLSITLFVMSSWYFQSVISTQKEQLLQLIDRQIEIDSQVAMLLKDRQSSVRAAKREILPEIPTDAKVSVNSQIRVSASMPLYTGSNSSCASTVLKQKSRVVIIV